MMGKFAQVLSALVLCTVSLAESAAAQAAIDVVGLERRTVIVEDRGLKTTFEGVALADVVAKTGVELGDKLRGKDTLSRVVIAFARDGYQAAYSIAEVDPGFSNQTVLVDGGTASRCSPIPAPCRSSCQMTSAPRGGCGRSRRSK